MSNALPDKIMAWHSRPTLEHTGTWATTRYPEEAGEYVKVSALPDLVKPLEWEGVEDDCFATCELGGRSYELCVVDTLERPCDYLWDATYRVGRWKSVPLGKPSSFEAAKAAAQRHHVAQIMSAFGIDAAAMKEGKDA